MFNPATFQKKKNTVAPAPTDVPGAICYAADVYRTEHLKARRVRMGMILLAFITYLIGYTFYRSMLVPSVPPKPYAAVVDIKGAIEADGKASFQALSPILRSAFEDEQAKGVILRINSPGGSPVQSSLIHDLVVKLKQKHNKPVIAVGEDMLTSGAYFIAVSADEIYVNRSTLAGSIGVISAGFGFQDAMDKLGVERRVSTAGNSKNINDPFMPQTDGQKKLLTGLLGDIHSHFKETVLDGRGERLNLDAPGLFEGMVWTGDGALKYGLVDRLGSLDDAKETIGVDVAYRMRPKGSFLEQFMDQLGMTVASHLKGIEIKSPQAIFAP